MRRILIRFLLVVLVGAVPATAAGQDQIFFPAVDDVATLLVQRINAENVRIDMGAWYLTERSISIALVNRFRAGVQVRLLGDRGSIFEIDPRTRTEFYWLASQGIPIRLRYHPTYYPEIFHWKATIFAGQNIVSFGSANYTPFELAPASSTNYKDEVVLFTADPPLVAAFRSRFDQIWNDTTPEPRSRVSGPPYLLNWDDACAREAACADYRTTYPNPTPMIINTARLEGDAPTPPEMVWGQGAEFNQRLVDEIRKEPAFVDFIIYRLTVPAITNALLAKRAAGVPVRLIVEPEEYRNRKWPEFWLTRAEIDRLWMAGVAIKQRVHTGLTHMKTLITSSTATVASSNFTAAWQRDHNYFVPADRKPNIHGAIRNRFNTMWNDPSAFGDFVPEPADAPTLQTPARGQTGVATSPVLTWARAPFATRYDVYVGTSATALTYSGTVQALLVNDPPASYSWTPSGLSPFTTYYWRVVSRTNANLSTPSVTNSFTTGDASGISATPRHINVSAQGGSASISLTAPAGMAWSVTVDANWLSVSPASGSGSRSLTVSVARNTTASSRSAVVAIGDARVTVTQEPNDPPPPPPGLSVIVSGTAVRFTWQRPSTSEVTGYLLEVSGRADMGGALVFETTATTYDAPDVPPGSYWVRVSAENSIGIGLPSPSVNFTVAPPAPVPPASPQQLQWSVQGARLTLTWTPGGGGSPSQYVIEAGVSPGRTDLVLGSGSPAPTFVYENVPPGVYYVRVRAMNAAGISGTSNEVAVFVGVPPPPSPPSNLQAATRDRTVTLTWSPVVRDGDGPSSYFILEAGTAPGVTNIGSVAVGATGVVVPGVAPGRYWVRVRAANATGVSAPSAEIMVSVP